MRIYDVGSKLKLLTKLLFDKNNFGFSPIRELFLFLNYTTNIYGYLSSNTDLYQGFLTFFELWAAYLN